MMHFEAQEGKDQQKTAGVSPVCVIQSREKIVQKKQRRLWVETLQHASFMTRGHCCTAAVRDPPWSQTLRGLWSITQPAVSIQQRAALSAVMRSEMMDTCSEVYLSVMYSWSLTASQVKKHPIRSD